MFKLALGTNAFGNCPRQELGLKSLLKCAEKFPDNIDLFNIQFENGKDLREVDGFKTLYTLKKTSNDVCSGGRELPLVSEMFDSLAELGYDYFCFINSDILVSPKFFNEIFSMERESYIASRLAIEGDIKDLDFSITLNSPAGEVRNSHYQVSGFDAFTIKSNWWKSNRELFPDYVYAVVYWDTHYATILLKHSDALMQNKNPSIFHIIHPDKSSEQCEEFIYNQSLFYDKHRDDFDLWHRYLYQVLLARGIQNNFLNVGPNEENLQIKYFKNL